MSIISSKNIRRDIIEMGYHCGANGAHFGGSLSCVEIMSVLYGKVMNFDIHNVADEKRDRIILSKGHGIMAQYAALKECGLLTDDDLLTFKQNDSELSAHPSINSRLGIEFSTGSLGQGLSLGVGVAMALKRKKYPLSRVFVILGDGECDEGSVWEAVLSAAHYGLSNLIAVVDRNHLQYDGDTETIMPIENFSAKWRAFGWQTVECDGHNEEELAKALSIKTNRPLVVIADTIKGKGISFMENQPKWHNGVLTKSLYETALAELEV